MNTPAALIPAPNLPAVVHETAAGAAAAQVKALVEARYMVAISRPRDMDTVRQKLMKECNRPSFAEVARYSRLQGKKKNQRTGEYEDNYIVGPSIRFAEAAIRCMGNIVIDEVTVYDDAEKRIIQVSVTDLEANVPYTTSVTIEKTVERRSNKSGQSARTRVNSYGDTVFILPATEDEVLNKKNAILSKAIRTLGLRHVPGDLVEEAMIQVVATQEAKDKQDPDAARKKIIDAFAALNVPVSELKKYTGQEIAALSPAELVELRSLHAAIKDGETTWKATIDERFPEEAARAARFSKDEAPPKPDATKADKPADAKVKS